MWFKRSTDQHFTHFHQGTPVLIVTVKGISTSAFSPILTWRMFFGSWRHTPWKMTVVDTPDRGWRTAEKPEKWWTSQQGKLEKSSNDIIFQRVELIKFWGCRYLGPPKPTWLEVLMVTNLVFRWPKPLFFMVLGARGKLWYRFAPKLLSLHKYPDFQGIWKVEKSKEKDPRYAKWMRYEEIGKPLRGLP